MKNKSKERKRSLTLKIFSGKPLWQFALVLFAWLALACPGNDGGGNGNNGNGNGASPFVCPNGTEVMATEDNMPTEANVENCAACNSGFGLAAGGGGMICRPEYVCTNGTPIDDTTTMANVENCASCDDGFREVTQGALTICQPEFVCPNGTAVDGMTTEANVENCTACNSGFHLTDGENTTQLCRRLTLTNVGNEADTMTLELTGAASVTTAVVGSTTYLFVAGQVDDGVSVFSVGNDGALTNVANVADGDDVVPDGVDGELELNGAISVTTAVVGSTTYLFVAGFDDDGVSVFSIGSNGALTNVDNEADTGTLELDGAFSVTTAVIGSTTYLFVARFFGLGGVSVFSVGSNGVLTNVANVDDSDDVPAGVDGELELSGAVSVTTAVVGSTTYLFVAGDNDDGVSVFSVGSTGALTNVDNEADTGTLELDGATSVTTAVIGGATYLFVAGNADRGVSVFSVGSNGALTNVDNEADTGSLNLNGAQSVTTAVVGRSTYLFVAGSLDAGVSVFSVASDGTLTNVANVDDSSTTVPRAPGVTSELELGGAFSVTTAVVGSATYLFVAGSGDDGVSVFRLGLAAE